MNPTSTRSPKLIDASGYDIAQSAVQASRRDFLLLPQRLNPEKKFLHGFADKYGP